MIKLLYKLRFRLISLLKFKNGRKTLLLQILNILHVKDFKVKILHLLVKIKII